MDNNLYCVRVWSGEFGNVNARCYHCSTKEKAEKRYRQLIIHELEWLIRCDVRKTKIKRKLDLDALPVVELLKLLGELLKPNEGYFENWKDYFYDIEINEMDFD